MTAIYPSLVAERLDSLQPFPKIILDIIRALDDEDANINQLVDYIKRDPVLVGKVLGMANLAGQHTGRGRVVNDVYPAISLLGLERVRNMVVGIVLGRQYGQELPGASADVFWGHCLDVGDCARLIAEKCGLKGEMAFIMGLLHDIGSLWLAANFNDDFNIIIQGAPHVAESRTILERTTLGMDHAQIGGELTRLWGLPEDMVHAVSGHHEPDPTTDPYTMVVHLAEVLSHALDLGQRPYNRVFQLSPNALPILGLSWDSLSDLFGEIEARSAFQRTSLRA